MKNMRKILLVLLAVLMAFSMVACSEEKESDAEDDADKDNSAKDYYDAVSESQGLLDEVADKIYSNWYDAIYEDAFGDDINVAIAAAQSSMSTELERIEELDGKISTLFKDAKETEAGAKVKEVMSAYSAYYEFVVNVSGSFQSYSADKETLKKDLASALRELSYEI